MKSPRVGQLFLKLCLRLEDQQHRLGDFEEVFQQIAESESKIKAVEWYWCQIFRTIPELIMDTMYWGGMMFKNYLKIALRNIKQQKIYSLINILGLAIGMAMALLIFLWVIDEKSYDRFHANAGRIYRVSQVHCNEGLIHKGANTPAVLVETLMQESPDVELATCLRGYKKSTIVQKGDKQFYEIGVGITDANFFKVFTFPIIKGDPENALASPGKVYISQNAVKLFFEGSDPIGQILTFYDQDFIVSGIFKDMPPNSHFHFDMLCSIKSFKEWEEPDWSWNPFKTYVLLKENGNVNALQKLLNTIASTRMFGTGYAAWAAKGNSKTLPLQKMMDIHLHSDLRWEFEANGNGFYVLFFTMIAAFILIIAVINYMNLSTARSARRAHEVGIRKTVGSTRGPLIRQFLMESVLTTLIALGIMLILTHLLLPAFRHLVGKSWLSVPYATQPLFIPLLFFGSVLIGILSGFYPAFLLSAFKPVSVLSGTAGRGMKSSKLRNVLVVFQFTLSIFLLTSALVVKKQMNFIRNKDLGFDRERVVVLPTYGEADGKIQAFKDGLLQISSIIKVTASSSLPGKSMDRIGFHVVGMNDSWPGINCFAVDHDFLDAMRIKMFDGRFFSNKIETDRQAVIINAKKAREIGLDVVYNQKIQIGGMGEEPFHVIGIIDDFHYQSLHVPVNSLALVLLGGTADYSGRYFSVRVRSSNYQKTIREIRKVWENIFPGVLFNVTFLDTITSDQYQNEERTGRVFSIFTLFALFVACIGLMGLASYAAEQRTREISIRKVLGASVKRLVLMLSGEFTRWVILANVIAWPLSYIVLVRWLENFSYRTSLSVMPFLLSALIMFGISGITVSYHTFRAARTNPVESLKYE